MSHWLMPNIDRMLAAATDGSAMDVVIVSTSSERQAAYWQERLDATRGQVAGRDAMVIAVHEDWPGGAGNGLGTLYALQCAARIARERDSVDLLARLRAGASIALYHTAGKGTRMAPLPGAEANNKPGVKLPGALRIDGRTVPITILEAVIRQTAIYAPSRGGRVSVFWGDQIFVPSVDPSSTPGHHADILCSLGAMPDAPTWAVRGMDKYGLIAVDAQGDARQVEKIDHATASSLVADGRLAVDGGIGVSLGSFSMSAALTDALLTEFAAELAARSGKLDTDPHFWMPLTLDPQTYGQIMAGKGVTPQESAAHHARMQDFATRLLAAAPELRLFAAVDVGEEASWWDYGQLARYQQYNLRLLDDDDEAVAMRRFFGIDDRRAGSQVSSDVDIDDVSIVLGCSLRRGKVRRCVLVGVDTETIEATELLAIAVAAPKITAQNAVIYNAASTEPIRLKDREVRADAHLPPDDHVSLVTDLARHGGDDWHETLDGNPCSYDALHKRNQAVDPAAAEALAAKRRNG